MGICAFHTFSIANFYNLFKNRLNYEVRADDYWSLKHLSGVLAKQLLNLTNRLDEKDMRNSILDNHRLAPVLKASKGGTHEVIGLSRTQIATRSSTIIDLIDSSDGTN